MHRLFVLLTFFILCSCQHSPVPGTSFYYWKTVFLLSPEEKSVLNENNVNRLYVRYFDVVVKNGAAVPESPVVFSESVLGWEIIPVVYIKNAVMLDENLVVEELASKVISLVEKINTGNLIKVNELQIDCDWSEKSKANYFGFLESLKSKSNLTLSATIRLHQIKYPERTGVPPVVKGVLMYYNMGRIGADASNSIYERSTANRYLDRLGDYSLPLDVALPVFVWGIHIRNNKIVGLLQDVDAETFRQDNDFEMLTPPFFETKESTFMQGHRFQKGDRVKIESISTEDLEGMTNDLKREIKNKPSEVIFYDLDKLNLKQFDHEDHLFQKISSDF